MCSPEGPSQMPLYCLQCSEDALVVWVGSNIFRGVYGGPTGIAYVLGIIYFGVVVSDMVSDKRYEAAVAIKQTCCGQGVACKL